MLHLQDLVKQAPQSKKVTINERLPDYIIGPCHLDVQYYVEAKDDFYLIHLSVAGELVISCQRCMEEFNFSYDNQTVIAACRSDDRAEQLLEHYECIVTPNWQVELNDLIIDELYLYVPLFHPEIGDCDSEINQILTGKNETY